MKLFSSLLLSFFILSCTNRQKTTKNIQDKRNKLLIEYLNSQNIRTTNLGLVIINPSYCGSCTEETIDWIVKYDKSNKKIDKRLITTGKIPESFDSILKLTSFDISHSDQDDIGRLGFTFDVSVYCKIKDGIIIDHKLIK